jgi:hypothetical protein
MAVTAFLNKLAPVVSKTTSMQEFYKVYVLTNMGLLVHLIVTHARSAGYALVCSTGRPLAARTKFSTVICVLRTMLNASMSVAKFCRHLKQVVQISGWLSSNTSAQLLNRPLPQNLDRQLHLYRTTGLVLAACWYTHQNEGSNELART